MGDKCNITPKTLKKIAEFYHKANKYDRAAAVYQFLIDKRRCADCIPLLAIELSFYDLAAANKVLECGHSSSNH